MARQTDQLLGEIPFTLTTNGIAQRIRKEVIDGRKPRCRHIAEPHHLYGSGTACEHGQGAVRRVSCQIDENIDLIRMNLRGDLLRRMSAHLPPLIRMRTQPSRHLIRLLRRAVNIDRKARAVIHRQKGLHEMLQHIAAKVRRNIAHANLWMRV